MNGEIRGKSVNFGGTAGTTYTNVPIPLPLGYPNAPANMNGIATASSTFARAIEITNNDATNNLLVIFPTTGNAVNTIKPGVTKDFYGVLPSLAVASSASTVAWTATAIVAA